MVGGYRSSKIVVLQMGKLAADTCDADKELQCSCGSVAPRVQPQCMRQVEMLKCCCVQAFESSRA